MLDQARALGEVGEQLSTLKLRQAELEDKLREARRPFATRLEILRNIYEDLLRAVDLPDLRTVTIDRETLLPYINGSLYVSSP